MSFLLLERTDGPKKAPGIPTSNWPPRVSIWVFMLPIPKKPFLIFSQLPPQFSDISYGFVWSEKSFSLIDPNTEGRLKIPYDADMDWVQSDFNDEARAWVASGEP